MPGIDVSLSEQQSYYEDLLKQYKRETELFLSYKDMCKFDLNQLDTPPPPPESSTSASTSSETTETAAVASAMSVDGTEATANSNDSSKN
jgi:hypothetical protein